MTPLTSLPFFMIGRHYDVDGLLNSWWTNTSEANFNSIKQCFSKQYSTFEVASFDSNNTIPVCFLRLQSLTFDV